MENFLASYVHRFLSKPKQKTHEAWQQKNYLPRPTVSFIIQSHNRSENVAILVEKLREFTTCEIIVLDDGSLIRHTKSIARLLRGANEFMIRSNDLYEVITYDRALSFARGEYAVLLQDDDDFDQLDWIQAGIHYFEQDSRLVILGGRDGGALRPFDEDGTGLRGAYTVNGTIASRTNSFKIQLQADPYSSPGLTYVQYVDRAPMWIRRNQYLTTLKGINVDFAPFQWDDTELCLRAWLVGLRVGHYSAKFKLGGLGTGGMRIWNNELHHRQDAVNAARLYTQFGNQLAIVDRLVEQCNQPVREVAE